MPYLRAYLAGPEVFLPEAVAIGQRKKQLCAKYGFEGLYPFDNEDRLCECLERFLSGKVDIAGMREAACALAKRWTWRHYRESFVALVRSQLADTSWPL